MWFMAALMLVAKGTGKFFVLVNDQATIGRANVTAFSSGLL